LTDGWFKIPGEFARPPRLSQEQRRRVTTVPHKTPRPLAKGTNKPANNVKI